MTYRIICERCSYVFYSGNSPVSVKEIINKYGGRCPRCLKKITPKSIKIMIKI